MLGAHSFAQSVNVKRIFHPLNAGRVSDDHKVSRLNTTVDEQEQPILVIGIFPVPFSYLCGTDTRTFKRRIFHQHSSGTSTIASGVDLHNLIKFAHWVFLQFTIPEVIVAPPACFVKTNYWSIATKYIQLI